MKLEELFAYKNKLMEDTLTNESIVNLITEDEKKRADPKLLAYTQVFPYEYIPETIEHGNTYICFDVDFQKSYGSGLLYDAVIYVWVMCHQDYMRLPQGGVRVDAICTEMCKVLDGSWDYGLGELDFYSSKRFSVLSNYTGKVLTFQATDLKRTNPNLKPKPSNRRAGI